jgi:predicted phosphodiesterase
MKIQPISDTHCEFWRNANNAPTIPQTDADVIVLAGDIDVGYENEVNFCKQLTQDHGKPVVFVLGNHSFYNKNMDYIRQQWYDNATVLADEGVQFLDDGITYVNGDTTFLGGILWTDFQDYNNVAMEYAKQRMNDFRITTMDIQDSLNSAESTNEHMRNAADREEYGKYWITPRRTVDEHKKTLEWMNVVLRDFKSEKNVVVSHHLPSYLSIHPLYAGDMLNAAFVSNLDNWISTKDITLWLHGHAHNSSDYMIEDTRVICNPFGYLNTETNSKCSLDLVVEI